MWDIGLFHTGPKGIAVGVAATVLMPLLFLAWAASVIARGIYPGSVARRRAAVVLARQSSTLEKDSLSARVLLGPPIPAGKWTVVKYPDSR